MLHVPKSLWQLLCFPGLLQKAKASVLGGPLRQSLYLHWTEYTQIFYFILCVCA